MEEYAETFHCVADSDGVIRGDTTVPSPGVVYLKFAVVETTTGCSSRAHTAKSTVTGPGINYDSGPLNLVDCEVLTAPLGDLRTRFLQLYTMAFEISGFAVGEEVTVKGILKYDDVAQPLFDNFSLSREDALHLPGFGLDKLRDESEQFTHRDLGAWINICKCLILKWFALFDVRSSRKGEELAKLLRDPVVIRFPDAELTSRKEFLDWYNERFPLVVQGYHEITDIEVRVLNKDLAVVALEVALTAELANGNQVKVNYSIVAEVVEFSTFDPKIRKYTASPIP